MQIKREVQSFIKAELSLSMIYVQWLPYLFMKKKFTYGQNFKLKIFHMFDMVFKLGPNRTVRMSNQVNREPLINTVILILRIGLC